MRIVELEPGTFKRLDIVDFRAVQIKEARLIHENLQAFVIVSLIEHTRRIFERHRVTETRAAATDHGNPEPGRFRVLRSHDFPDFANRCFCQIQHSSDYTNLSVG